MRDLASVFRADADRIEATISFRDAPWDSLTVRAGISELVPTADGTPRPTGSVAAGGVTVVPVDVSVEGARFLHSETAFSAEHVGVSAGLRQREGAWDIAGVDLAFHGGEIRYPPLHVVCAGLQGAVSAPGDRGSVDARLSVERLQLGVCSLPPLEMAVSGTTSRVTGRFAWKSDGVPILSLQAVLPEIVAPLSHGSLTVTGASWPAGRDDPILACLRDRSGWDIRSGVLGMEADLAWDAAQPDAVQWAGHGRVRLHDLVLTRGGIRVEGLAGEVEVADLVAGATPLQRITFDRLVVPRTELTEGEIRFRADAGWRWFVDTFSCTWGNGRITATGFEVDPAQGRARTMLDVSGVELAEVLRVVFGEGVTGSGTLEGRMPVAVRWSPRAGIMLGEGTVTATGSGRLRVKDPEIARRWVEQAGVGTGIGAAATKELRQRLVEALGDFEYSTLRLTARPGTEGRPAGELEIEGKGAGPRGLPIRLTVRFALLPLGEEG